MSDVALPLHGRFDRLGVALCVACIVHCLASPVLVVAATAAGLRLAEDGVHAGLAGVAVAVGLVAFVPGYHRHRRARVPAGAVLGTALLWAPSIAGEGLGTVGEPLVVIAGGLALVQAHRWNRSFCASCASCGRGGRGLDPSTRQGYRRPT